MFDVSGDGCPYEKSLLSLSCRLFILMVMLATLVLSIDWRSVIFSIIMLFQKQSHQEKVWIQQVPFFQRPF